MLMDNFHSTQLTGQKSLKQTKKENHRTTLFTQNKVSNCAEAFRLLFDRNFVYFPAKWEWIRNEIFGNGTVVSV